MNHMKQIKHTTKRMILVKEQILFHRFFLGKTNQNLEKINSIVPHITFSPRFLFFFISFFFNFFLSSPSHSKKSSDFTQKCRFKFEQQDQRIRKRHGPWQHRIHRRSNASNHASCPWGQRNTLPSSHLRHRSS